MADDFDFAQASVLRPTLKPLQKQAHQIGKQLQIKYGVHLRVWQDCLIMRTTSWNNAIIDQLECDNKKIVVSRQQILYDTTDDRRIWLNSMYKDHVLPLYSNAHNIGQERVFDLQSFINYLNRLFHHTDYYFRADGDNNQQKYVQLYDKQHSHYLIKLKLTVKHTRIDIEQVAFGLLPNDILNDVLDVVYNLETWFHG